MKLLKRLLLIIIYPTTILILSTTTLAAQQQLVPLIDETIVVNSTSSLNGYNRNRTAIQLPERTRSYIYRISVSPKGSPGINTPLLELLQKLGGTTSATMGSLADLAIKNNDNYAVDAYIFNNIYDVDKFYNKASDWSACKEMPGRANCCFSTDDCISRSVYFGFRNNNITLGLQVRLEVVAVTDPTLKSPYQYAYSISNDTQTEVNFSLSTDGKQWYQKSLKNGYKLSPSLEFPQMYIRMQTGPYKTVSYKINPNERYRFYWNQQKSLWDLTTY